jgi:hypothetical protein
MKPLSALLGISLLFPAAFGLSALAVGCFILICCVALAIPFYELQKWLRNRKEAKLGL